MRGRAVVLTLRRSVVVTAEEPVGGWQRLTAALDGEQRPAVADTALVGACAAGDEIVVNAAAIDLSLGSGGADVVHVNLTRGLGGAGVPGAHVMKLNYSSLQHAILPVEGEESAGADSVARSVDAELAELGLPLTAPVAVFPLHGHLAPVAWALAQTRPGTRVGFVQTAGGALPGAMSATVRELRERGLLHGHTTAGPAYGGEREAITTAGAIQDGIAAQGWEVALVGPGPGILGSGSALGHGGIVAMDSAHAALALGCRTLLVARMSSGDPRPRHQGLSHHTRTVLELLLAPVTLPVPLGAADPAFAAARARGHLVHEARADLAGYRASGLPARTMGRELEDDQPFFAAALAAGTTLGGML
ncbi:DUF3866 family protein [Conexibacter sp. JD483]|uniref:DUF3866 family protein n=1 Tax=unclassified Conexibacter TaxID=2627773 RepID=UPI002719FEEC|nr:MULTISPECIES: DUF3866 family protein [unclassified Conexibacter]MDO8185087.1 DUF3866 family protein [Conexibacter sp. CPCC 205706]MDO8196797.1 DUF3866 family protein [Conexibacter sp. CPCC 205762]MDR9368045.1 DUF3866 family protein [Conexibacter sp. JD483]